MRPGPYCKQDIRGLIEWRLTVWCGPSTGFLKNQILVRPYIFNINSTMNSVKHGADSGLIPEFEAIRVGLCKKNGIILIAGSGFI
ncbi:hypothetical protein C488_14817 [Natrinema pellirubrum DSM 15624]|uniref:Uncharacterized protein n=1 Tax=Natrinema pellirubrum (strain DSM 15624 / CIP 106293 / JCM 10476 / NCIMB 786 / 157) TaxID=797303 RepID=L9YFA4_NATP1|nr:hypothetical protein C488_14817 [Natrinema pellirubrum DSM 15624]